MADPFKIRNAENADPADIGLEFVEEHTEYAKIAAHEHTLAWGSRGSGKTMHLRFLEPAAWMARHEPQLREARYREFIADGNGFIGIYINCREPALSREEFRVYERSKRLNDGALLVLIDRYLAQAIIHQLSATFLEQLPFFGPMPLEAVNLSLGVASMLPRPAANIGQLMDHLRASSGRNLELGREAFDTLFLEGHLPNRTTEWIQGLPSVAPDTTSLIEEVRDTIGSRSPFFLMFDEANELSDALQQAVSSLLARRSQRVICVKVASQLNGFRTERATGRPAQEVHDYVAIDLDSLYTNNQDAYYKRVRDIANLRLRAAGLSHDVSEYLPPNPRDIERGLRARELAAQRYDALPDDRRPKDRANYVKKYAPAIVFQELAHPKGGKSYAGFDNIVHLSSGIVRSFLDCCSLMYARCLESTPEQVPPKIPVSIQNEVIDTYSDEFLAALVRRADSLRSGTPERQAYADLYSLLRGLGGLFKSRLMDRRSREPRIISVSLKDVPAPRLAAALTLAEQDAYLHKVWYRSKRGTGKLPCYVLNRRLCPHFGLDIAGFQGRIEMFSAELELALSSPEDFAVTFSGSSQDEAEMSPDQIPLWEW